MAPPIDYIIKVFKPTAAKFGVEFECEKKRRGFYPRGGGEVVVKPHPVHHLTPATITEPGHVVSVSVHAYVAGTVPEKTAHQLAQSARQQVEKQLPGVAIEISEVHETAASAYGSGSGIIVVAETSTGCLLGGSANGKKGEPPYKTGRAAADQLLKAVKEGACVDDQLQDQLIIFMALAKGQSVIRTGALSLHTKTAIHTARALTPVSHDIITLCVMTSPSVWFLLCVELGRLQC
jgi:RNA 3'-terminal phosphate cyclase (ATP)